MWQHPELMPTSSLYSYGEQANDLSRTPPHPSKLVAKSESRSGSKLSTGSTTVSQLMDGRSAVRSPTQSTLGSISAGRGTWGFDFLEEHTSVDAVSAEPAIYQDPHPSPASASVQSMPHLQPDVFRHPDSFPRPREAGSRMANSDPPGLFGESACWRQQQDLSGYPANREILHYVPSVREVPRREMEAAQARQDFVAQEDLLRRIGETRQAWWTASSTRTGPDQDHFSRDHPWAESQMQPQPERASWPYNSVQRDHTDQSQLGASSVSSRLQVQPQATTLMVRNIPVRYTQDMLLKEWPNDDGSYNFLYLPICIKRKCNASYCFINFVTPQAALAFATLWHHKRLMCFSSRKPLDISLADLQGLDANLSSCMRNKTSRIRNSHFQPVLFVGKRRVSIEEYLQDNSRKVYFESISLMSV